jgi:hypothetical protein
MPGYFADRYAFALRASLKRLKRPPSPALPRRATSRSRDDYLDHYLLPTAGLDGWRPILHAPTGVGDFYGELCALWCAHCRRLELPTDVAYLPDARVLTWRQIFDASVFYPRPPVFRGATYWDTLSEERRRHILRVFGKGAPVEFYCFMQQVHETIHAVQKGEPLLNEIVQAALWIEFLDTSRLWDFQRRSDGSGMVREENVVRRHDRLAELAVRAGLDTAMLVDAIAPTDAYLLCCTVANLFDRRQITYATYLSLVSDLLVRADDPDWLRRRSTELRAFASAIEPHRVRSGRRDAGVP